MQARVHRATMGLFGGLARTYLINRLLRGGQGHHPPRGHHGWGGSYPPSSAYRTRRSRGGVRFFGPVPYYSGTTRRGTRVSAGGCCLPLPVMLVSSAAVAAVRLGRRSGVGRALRGR